MNKACYITEEELVEKAVSILFKELGPIETIRFVNLSRKRRLESVQRHREWQQKLDKKRFFKEIFGSGSRPSDNRDYERSH